METNEDILKALRQVMTDLDRAAYKLKRAQEEVMHIHYLLSKEL